MRSRSVILHSAFCILTFLPLMAQDSPLEQALLLKKAARNGRQYGQIHNGKLIPEVVRRGDFEIGRFEVTRAQYYAWDNGYPVAPGTENYPANGITLPEAKGYCEWLSQLTGQIYRVPGEDETAALYASSAGENTLDYWAGKLDPARIKAMIKELGGTAPLLKEVGSFPAKDGLYDLGGNVTEWVVTKDGKGKTAGGSADRAADPKARNGTVDPYYTGFRIVRGTK